MATVVVGVTKETAGASPEVSIVGATVVEDDSVGTAEDDVDRGQWEIVEKEDGDETIAALAAVTVWGPLVTLQFVTGTVPSV